MSDFEERMKTTKNIPFDKKHVLIEKETFDSINNVIKETKKVAEFQLKMEQLFNEVDNFTKSHQSLEKENQNMQQEIKSLKTRNQNLTQENNNLKSYLKAILEALKHFLENYYRLVMIRQKKPQQAKLKTIIIIKILICMMLKIFLKVLQKKMNYLIMLKYLVI